MGITMEIEKAINKADVLESTLLAIIDASYYGSFHFETYEDAFYGVHNGIQELAKELRALADKLYSLRKEVGEILNE